MARSASKQAPAHENIARLEGGGGTQEAHTRQTATKKALKGPMWEGEEGRSLHANKGGQESSRGDEREIMERGGEKASPNQQPTTAAFRPCHSSSGVSCACAWPPPPPPPLGDQASGQGQQRVRTAVNDARREEWAGGVMGEMERNARRRALYYSCSLVGPSKLERHWTSKAKAKEGNKTPFENWAFLSGRRAEG